MAAFASNVRQGRSWAIDVDGVLEAVCHANNDEWTYWILFVGFWLSLLWMGLACYFGSFDPRRWGKTQRSTGTQCEPCEEGDDITVLSDDGIVVPMM